MPSCRLRNLRILKIQGRCFKPDGCGTYLVVPAKENLCGTCDRAEFASPHFSSSAMLDKRYSMENYLLSSPESCLCMFISCTVKGLMEKRVCEDLEICIIIRKGWGLGLGSHKHY